MADFRISPSELKGSVFVPPSKSHTLRAIFFGALAKGTTRIEHFLPSPDSASMMEAMRLLGAQVQVERPHILHIQGLAGKPRPAEDVIQCGNSGQVLRFVGALAGLIPEYTILTGDHSIRHNRPVKPLLDAMQQLGAFAVSSRGDGYAPILIKGPFTKNKASLEGRDSQPVSGLLMASAFAPHPTEIQVKNPGETPWIDLTLHWLNYLKIRYTAQNYTHYHVEGSSEIQGFHYSVPGDFSSAAFPIAAALLTHSELTLQNIDMDDIQGDKAIIPILEEMGARFIIDKVKRTLTVKKNLSLKGMRIDVNHCIDALPILSVIGCFAEGETEIVNASIAREKESDRIASMCRELKKMGAKIEERPDGLIIHRSSLHAAKLDTYHDHRIALSLSVASFAAKGISTVQGVECIAKTYPTFYDDFRAIGAQMEI